MAAEIRSDWIGLALALTAAFLAATSTTIDHTAARSLYIRLYEASFIQNFPFTLQKALHSDGSVGIAGRLWE